MLKGINLSPRVLPYPTGASVGGLDIVRFPFQAAAIGASLEQAFSIYDPIMATLRGQNIRPILILLAETFGNGGYPDGTQPPWVENSTVSWEKYAADFAAVCRRISSRYGLGAIYQIWNEGDIHGKSSVYVPPVEYGLILRAALAAIRSIEPEAVVLTQGHASGAGAVRDYWQQVTKAGQIAVSGLAIHPYGQFLGERPAISNQFFPERGTGKFRDYMSIVRLLGLPLWVTEMGIAGAKIPASQYPAVADYMQEIYQYLRSLNVKAFVWWAYHEEMEQGGIVEQDNMPKPFIYSAFKSLPVETKASPPPTPPLPMPPVMITGRLWVQTTGTYVNLRRLPSINSAILGRTYNGSVLTRDVATQELWDKLATTLRISEKWYAVRISDTQTGFIYGSLAGDIS